MASHRPATDSKRIPSRSLCVATSGALPSTIRRTPPPLEGGQAPRGVNFRRSKRELATCGFHVKRATARDAAPLSLIGPAAALRRAWLPHHLPNPPFRVAPDPRSCCEKMNLVSEKSNSRCRGPRSTFIIRDFLTRRRSWRGHSIHGAHILPLARSQNVPGKKPNEQLLRPMRHTSWGT